MKTQPATSPISEKTARTRIVYVDFLRLLASFFVIVNHTNSRVFMNSEISLGWYASVAYFFLCKVAVPVFLMITGIVSLNHRPDWSRYRRKVCRVLVIIVVANLFYLVFYRLLNPGRAIVLRDVIRAIFYSASRPLWYLYVYLICTMFMPFFQKLAATLSRREERLFLLLSVGLNGLLAMLPLLDSSAKINYMFPLATVNSYIGYLFLGHYFEKYAACRKKDACIALVLLLSILALEVALTGHYYRVDPKNYLKLEDRTFLTNVTKSWCLLVIAKALLQNADENAASTKAIGTLGRLTFGVFLLAEIGISLLEPMYDVLARSIPRMAAMLLFELAVFLSALAVTAIVRKIPGVRNYL